MAVRRILVATALLQASVTAQQDPLQFVDPLIGTANGGTQSWPPNIVLADTIRPCISGSHIAIVSSGDNQRRI